MDYQAEKISADISKLYKPIVQDYLKADSKLKDFFRFPHNIEGVDKAIQIRQKHQPDRSLLVNVLNKQYSRLNAKVPEIVKKQIELLKNPDSFTVTTGHQLQIYMGPHFFIYKIVACIKLAKELKKKYPDKDFIPLFWMASEDHDFEEISSVYLFGKKYKWERKAGGAVGRMSTAGLAEVANEIHKHTSDYHQTEIISIMKKAYEEHDNLADASREILNHLFGEKALLILDPDDKELKQSFKSIISKEVFEQLSNKKISESCEKLEKYYETAVNPREINLFYFHHGKRVRLEQLSGEADKFRTLGENSKTFSKEDIEKEIENHPERFSPNVSLRPVYQEFVLPNLAYIGGPAEIAYWLEFKSAFEAYDVFYPQLVLRPSFLWIGKTLSKKMRKLKLDSEAIFLSDHELAQSYLKKNENVDRFDEKIKKASESLQKLKEAAEELPENTKWPVIKHAVNEIKALAKLKKDLRKSLKKQHDLDIEKLINLKALFFPEGVFQERIENFIPYYMRYGKTYFDALEENALPYETGLNVIRE